MAIYPIIFLLLLVLAIILLQVFLSKKENKWFGLILPSLAFLFSIATILFAVDLGNRAILLEFFLLNIPTIILLLIFLGYREKHKKSFKSEMDKINIQEL